MPFCQSRNFTIEFNRDVDDARLDTLFFLLDITGSIISGNVFPSVGSTPLSSVTGTCQSFMRPDSSLFTMTFTWNTVTVSVIGVVSFHNGKRRVTFEGRFSAAAHTDAQVPQVLRDPNVRLVIIPPSDGDTGTASGQQT